MPDQPLRPAVARALDAAAVDAALRRLARQPEAPWLHREVARRMAERLPLVRLQPDVIVDWWGHSGGAAALIGAAYPRARRVVVEPTASLAERSRHDASAPWWSARRWRQGGAEVRLGDPEPGSAQLLWSNMMLHAASDPPGVIARWQRALAVDGFLMFSCLGPGSLRALHDLYRMRGWGEPGAALVDMHDLGDMLVAGGFADPVMDQETVTLTWDAPQSLLTELRSLGVNASPARAPGLRTPRWRARLAEELRTLAGPDGRLRLAFEIVYGHAFKGAPRAAPNRETRVTVEEMRARARAARANRG